jgi:hypothetical protein
MYLESRVHLVIVSWLLVFLYSRSGFQINNNRASKRACPEPVEGGADPSLKYAPLQPVKSWQSFVFVVGEGVGGEANTLSQTLFTVRVALVKMVLSSVTMELLL